MKSYCCAAVLFLLACLASPAKLATAAAAPGDNSDILAKDYTRPEGGVLNYLDPTVFKDFCLSYATAAGATSGGVKKVGSSQCGPSSLRFRYDPKTKALQIVSSTGTPSGACLTDSGSFTSGKNTPGDLAVAQCASKIGPSQQWTLRRVPVTVDGTVPNHNLRSDSGLCIGLDGWDLVTVRCGDKSEILF